MASERKIARECVGCGAAQPKRYGIPDPCLGRLEGVANACCGHGNEARAYVQFQKDDKGVQVTVRGRRALLAMLKLGGHPAPFDRDSRTGHSNRSDSAWEGWRRTDG